MSDCAFDWSHYRIDRRYRRPPRVIRCDDHPVGHPWVLLDSAVPGEPDEVEHDRVIGVYSTRRRAWRGLLRSFVERDSRPLDRLHRLTWQMYPGGWLAWDDAAWGETEADRYCLTWGWMDDDEVPT